MWALPRFSGVGLFVGMEIDRVILNLIINSITMVLILKKGANKKEMDAISEQLNVTKGVDTKRYCGTIKLKEDSLEIQKQMRNEWR